MKKLFSSIILIIALCFAAPTANAQFRWSGTAGVSINNLSFKQDLVSVSQTVGYAAGINGELMFPGIGMGMSFGLLYNQQGAKVNLGERLVWSSEGYGNEQVFLHTASIPVHLRFKYTRLNGFEDKIAPLVFAGPEFNIQVAHGNCKAFDYSGGDLGVTVGAGAEIFKRWQLTGSYTWGMTYVLKTSLLDNFSARSRQWNIRLAYFF
jgi:hypothetical protein